MFRFMLSGLGLEAPQIDAQASALNRFTPGQFDGELRLELTQITYWGWTLM